MGGAETTGAQVGRALLDARLAFTEVAVGASSTKSGGGIGGVSSNIEDDRERREICQGERITITLSVTERNIRR